MLYPKIRDIEKSNKDIKLLEAKSISSNNLIKVFSSLSAVIGLGM